MLDQDHVKAAAAISFEYFAPTRAQDVQFQNWWARMLRLASSPGGIKAILEVGRQIDVRHIRPSIRVPTLVLHRAGDRVTRVQGGKYLAQHIPGAAYVELIAADHWWWVGNPDSLLAEVATFLRYPLASNSRPVYTA